MTIRDDMQTTIDDMNAVSAMLEQAGEFNLQTEVVYSFAQNLINGETDIEKACCGAMIEWDVA